MDSLAIAQLKTTLAELSYCAQYLSVTLDGIEQTSHPNLYEQVSWLEQMLAFDECLQRSSSSLMSAAMGLTAEADSAVNQDSVGESLVAMLLLNRQSALAA
jgi:hypothetical protein